MVTSKQLKKDGTIYLVFVKYENDTEEWVLTKWGKPAALSDPYQNPGWLVGNWKIKVKEFIHFFEFYKLSFRIEEI